MIVKFHSRGVGRGSGPVGYLLGQNRDRDRAVVLRGDPDTTEQLIDSTNFAQRYTSGVLSFAEADLTPEQKAEIMDSFETMLMPGLDADQRDVLWVEHTDKGRLELNFLIPNVELTTGKRLAPYYDKVDRTRVNAFQQVVNDAYRLVDPNDPRHKRALTTANDLPRDRKEAAETITHGLLNLASAGEIRNREDVIRSLESAGFTVTRQTNQSISIADPTKEEGKPIRLKGAIYERDFEFGPRLREQIEEAGRQYDADRAGRIEATRKTLAESIRAKREYNRSRYPRPEPTVVKTRTQKLAVDRADTSIARNDERRSALVDGQPNRFEHQRDPAPENSAGGSAEQRRADSPEPVRAESMRSSGPDTAIQRQRWPHVHDGEVNHDQARTGIISRIRIAIGRVHEVAERIRTGYRKLDEASAGLNQASAELERSSQQWNREVGRADYTFGRLIEQRQAQHQAHRPGPTLGR